jgi:hypothetical protein
MIYAGSSFLLLNFSRVRMGASRESFMIYFFE